MPKHVYLIKLEDLTLANKTTAIKARFNKTQILNDLAENTEITVAQGSPLLSFEQRFHMQLYQMQEQIAPQ